MTFICAMARSEWQATIAFYSRIICMSFFNRCVCVCVCIEKCQLSNEQHSEAVPRFTHLLI